VFAAERVENEWNDVADTETHCIVSLAINDYYDARRIKQYKSLGEGRFENTIADSLWDRADSSKITSPTWCNHFPQILSFFTLSVFPTLT
jgi:hypothetical protein